MLLGATERERERDLRRARRSSPSHESLSPVERKTSSFAVRRWREKRDRVVRRLGFRMGGSACMCPRGGEGCGGHADSV